MTKYVGSHIPRRWKHAARSKGQGSARGSLIGLMLLAIVAALAVWAIVARLSGSTGIALRPARPAFTTGWTAPAAPSRTHGLSGTTSHADALSTGPIPTAAPRRAYPFATPSHRSTPHSYGRPDPSQDPQDPQNQQDPQDPQVADPPETTPPPTPELTPPACDRGVLGVVERLLGC